MKPKRYVHGELSVIQKTAIYAVLFLFLGLFLFPIFWMVSTSLKTLGQVFQLPMIWIPNPPQWDNFAEVFRVSPFGTYLWNTIWYTGVTVFATVLTSSLVAFAFARLRARGSKVMFGLVLSTMMLPPQVVMIPQYLLFNQLGWVDSYLPLVIPSFAASAFLIFLLRQFYMGISHELDEAVKIDGGGYFTMYFRVILPLSLPAMATGAILEFMYRWNDLMGPLIYLNSSEHYPLSLGLANFTASYGSTPWQLLMAASVIAVTPPLLLFFFAQKHFIRGIVISGSKG
ncbi:carbohydrate ABC transporter permease [Paenibacillus apiarius]|uniref:Carbohydrate ABC transporter permease n=1 Tax=Paenibacillus apiarius TaxID=46240 RepID=A0ABT4DPY9_9BACL|nr:carbohydrate ABC transporter permease [Paenibacillus apiarius]MBN3526154.1 carbohydrate ABC transporter permease [Paenibacillus apiarius]MCY9517728.1 carbohydrate ABC transporter permease [Paenibacillus apiarius]MCY9518328.1 carbohydrate ABC transporter permease [Paenibacillus apiarius]MCY9551271.1 carbohydrate ABC transporter permease [Paenibacillus apiarius]MCY9558425.1 carbohydrate ABC transporter permease [Paenibacillus apiarius]